MSRTLTPGESARVEDITTAAYAGGTDRKPEDDVRWLLRLVRELAVSACDTCQDSGVVTQEGQIGVPGSGCYLTCPDCGPSPSVVVDPDLS